MGKEYGDDCAGCPQGCIHCGRGPYIMWYCDGCGADTEELYVHGEDELCWECYKKEFLSKICDDMDETKCSSCGCEAEEMFQIEGHEWVCEDCLMDLAEKVDTEGEPYDPRE